MQWANSFDDIEVKKKNNKTIAVVEQEWAVSKVYLIKPIFGVLLLSLQLLWIG